MRIVINVTEKDVIAFGSKHDRPVTREKVVKALSVVIQRHTSKIENLKQEIISKALDLARLS